MLAAAQFEDGSLVFQDDTLDVNGGSAVNLLVKLGAKPRSNVTVALSETSALISLDVASLTFTPDNWDTFQSVMVTAAGNRQAIDIPAARFTPSGNTSVVWDYINVSAPAIDGALRKNSNVPAYLHSISSATNGSIVLRIRGSQIVSQDTDVRDLSDAFESSGSIGLAGGGSSFLASMAGADTAEPYNFTPSDSAEAAAVTAFATALVGETNDTVAATLTLRDYVPPAAPIAIALAATGPSEYSGVTGSAQVTVN